LQDKSETVTNVAWKELNLNGKTTSEEQRQTKEAAKHYPVKVKGTKKSHKETKEKNTLNSSEKKGAGVIKGKTRLCVSLEDGKTTPNIATSSIEKRTL